MEHWNDKIHVLKISGFIKPNLRYWKSLESLEKQILFVRLFKSHVQQGVPKSAVLKHPEPSTGRFKKLKLKGEKVANFFVRLVLATNGCWKVCCLKMCRLKDDVLVAGRRCKILFWTDKRESRIDSDKTWNLKCQFHAILLVWIFTLPETNIAPENGWLEYLSPFGMAYFQEIC